MTTREDLISKAEKKIGKKIPQRYIPKSLSIADLKKQLKSIVEKTDRPKISSGKTRRSPFTIKADRYFDGKTSLSAMTKKITSDPVKQRKLASGFRKILSKGRGAYYSSGSRPLQTAESWAKARLYSVLFGGKARNVDKKIVEEYGIPLLKT